MSKNDIKGNRRYYNDDQNVAIEQRQCAMCAEAYDTDTLLLATRYVRASRNSDDMKPLRPFKRDPIVGLGICDTCKQKYTGLPLEEYNHVCLLEADPNNISLHPDSGDGVQLVDISKEVGLTGKSCFVNKRVWDRLFNIPAPEHGVGFVEPECLEYLRRIEGAQEVEVEHE